MPNREFLKTIVQKKDPGGFALLEIFIAAVIAGILASVIFVIFNDGKISSRNALREDEINGVRSGLADIYNKSGRYPIEEDWCLIDAVSGDCSNFSEEERRSIIGGPSDPLHPEEFQPGCRYGYYYKSSIDGKSYELAAKMERYSNRAGGDEFLYVSSTCESASIGFVGQISSLCGQELSRGPSVGGN